MNCCVAPSVTLGFAGVTAMELSVGGRTVSVVLPVTPASVAETVVVPMATAVARPVAPIVAAAAFVDAQFDQPRQVLGRAVGVGARRRELLGEPGWPRSGSRA